MKKITWSELKEKTKTFYKDHKELCIFIAGASVEIGVQSVIHNINANLKEPVKVKININSTDGEKAKIRVWNIDRFGRETYASGIDLKPAQAIHVARDILYYLAGEAD